MSSYGGALVQKFLLNIPTQNNKKDYEISAAHDTDH